MMAVFIWDRFRYDVVACCALILAVAVGTFLLFFHWLVPSRTKQNSSIEDAVEIKNYTSELVISEESVLIDEPLSTLLKLGDGEVIASAVLRGATRMAPFPDLTLRQNDIILLEGRLWPSTEL